MDTHFAITATSIGRLETMRRTAALRSLLGTLAGGALVGFVVTAFAGSFIAGFTSGGRPADPPVARAFMTGLLKHDAEAVRGSRPAEGIVAGAARIQSTSGATSWRPAAVSYLGGAELSGIGIYMYVAEVRTPDGSQSETVPFAVTVQGGKVVRVQ